MNKAKSKVTIGACTFRRQDGLRDLLASIAKLRCDADVSIDIVIVDNDETPSAKELVQSLAPDLPWPCRYIHEPRPGIPQARNRILEECLGSDFLLFVDDDETVDPELLNEHLRIQKQTGAQFVQGPCIMTVPDTSDAWWLDTAFFKQKTFADAAPRYESWTNNVLIEMQFVERNNVRFDDMLRYAGGSDTLFFQDIVRAGGKGAFAAKAIVYEVQTKSRLNWRWALNRQYRYGVTRANTQLLRKSKPQALIWCFFRSFVMIVAGFLLTLTALYKGKIGLANGAALIARGWGLATGAFGFRADEYARN